MATLVQGGRFTIYERIHQRQHMFRLWRRLAEYTGVQTPPFKYSNIYRQPKHTLMTVAEAIGLVLPVTTTHKDIVAALDNYVFQ